MVKVPQQQTVYADYLYLKIEELLNRVGQFTLKELANYAGLKVTGNMRRRVQHCVVAGTLSVTPVYMQERGSANLYYRPREEKAEEDPKW